MSILRPLPARLYSIASSQHLHPHELHLLVRAVRYRTEDRDKKGAASTCLADRIQVGGKVPIFIRPNEEFRLPEDFKRPVMMVGPGTGVAPFRAFLQERRVRALSEPVGKSWLFFGNRYANSDFFYEDELLESFKTGTLTRLNTAFSRDQEEKIYVTHEIQKNAKDVYAWLEEGASVYVCGGKDMAADVYGSFVSCVELAGSLSREKAEEYGRQLLRSGRYLEDVY